MFNLSILPLEVATGSSPDATFAGMRGLVKVCAVLVVLSLVQVGFRMFRGMGRGCGGSFHPVVDVDMGLGETGRVRREAAIRRIDQTLAEYGGRLSDPSWVIEHYAIERLSYPESAAFAAACTRVQDTDLERVGVEYVERLASEVSITWREALRHAERVGYAALGENAEKGRRANSLLAKAQSTAAEAERAALMEKVGQLLLVCGIVLPLTTRRALEAIAPLALSQGE